MKNQINTVAIRQNPPNIINVNQFSICLDIIGNMNAIEALNAQYEK